MDSGKNKIINTTKDNAGKGYQILFAKKPSQNNGKSLDTSKDYEDLIRQKKKRLRKEFINKLFFVVFLIVIFAGYIFYKSYRSSFEVKCLSDFKKPDTELAIELGKLYAYSLLENYYYTLDGRSCELLKLSTNEAEKKMIEKMTAKDFFHYFEVEKQQIYEKKKMLEKGGELMESIAYMTHTDFPVNYSEPIFSSISDLELINFNRIGDVVNMTFMYSKDGLNPISIPDKGNLIFSIEAKYVNNKNWLISDYNYQYNINDYIEWLLAYKLKK